MMKGAPVKQEHKDTDFASSASEEQVGRICQAMFLAFQATDTHPISYSHVCTEAAFEICRCHACSFAWRSCILRHKSKAP